MTTPKRAATAAAKRRLFVSVGRPSALPRDTTRERYVEQVITHATEPAFDVSAAPHNAHAVTLGMAQTEDGRGGIVESGRRVNPVRPSAGGVTLG
jgi:hypothetical protein